MKGVSDGDVRLEEMVLPELLQLREKRDHK